MASMRDEETDVEAKEDERKNFDGVIAKLYDTTSKIMEEIAGDHFHVGFYDSSFTIPGTDVRSAQIRMIEAALRFASVSEDSLKKPKNILDVGCGIGGSSRYLASKYGAQCKGITLSPLEVERASIITAAQGLQSKDIKFADWSQHVAPYYSEMRKLTLSWKGIMSFVRHGGWKHLSIKMLMMPSVTERFKNGFIKYSIITCQKPE